MVLEAVDHLKQAEPLIEQKAEAKSKLKETRKIKVSDVRIETPVNVGVTSTTDSIVTTTPRLATWTINIVRPRINLFYPPSMEPEILEL